MLTHKSCNYRSRRAARLRVVLIVVLITLRKLAPESALAASLRIVPTAQSAQVGQSVGVDVVIDDLGGDTIGAFDLDVNFDPTIVSPTNIIFGTFLGDMNLLEALTSFGFLPGIVDVAEVSLLSPLELEALQPASFTLATVLFTTVGVGTSPLRFPQVILDDAFAQPLSVAAVDTGSVAVRRNCSP